MVLGCIAKLAMYEPVSEPASRIPPCSLPPVPALAPFNDELQSGKVSQRAFLPHIAFSYGKPTATGSK